MLLFWGTKTSGGEVLCYVSVGELQRGPEVSGTNRHTLNHLSWDRKEVLTEHTPTAHWGPVHQSPTTELSRAGGTQDLEFS